MQSNTAEIINSIGADSQLIQEVIAEKVVILYIKRPRYIGVIHPVDYTLITPPIYTIAGPSFHHESIEFHS